MKMGGDGGGRRQSPLASYTLKFGRLVERRMATAALVAARQEAERQAEQATRAMMEARTSNQALRQEIQHRLQTQSRLAYLASHDPLTALPNRTLFNDRLSREMDQARRNAGQLALHYIDLDHFKDVNDTLGHAAGDALLKEVALRLEECLRNGETVARMGGDEFAVLQLDANDPASARALATRIITALGQPFDVAGQQIFIGASVGITLFPADGTDPEMLHRNADLALYRAKRDGRSRCQFFDSILNDEAHRRIHLERGLHQALRHGELSLAFQPQVTVADGHVVGAEALLRWHHPEHGHVAPEEFIPVAERCGLINTIGEWVMHQTCRQAVAWDAAGLPPLMVAVNVATAQFRGGDVPRLVAGILEATGLPAHRLELEITETGVMSDMRDAAEILAALHRIGVSLAIDDFGTGYSSLSYLRRLPVDRIKIDRSFVSDVTHNEDAAVVATTIMTLARNLRLEVVAEGVETQEHADFVRDAGCRVAQGFFYGRPTRADDFAHRIAAHYFAAAQAQ